MNKAISFIACLSIAAFSQNEQQQYVAPENPPKQEQRRLEFGVRSWFSVNGFSPRNKYYDEYIDNGGIGFGTGIVMNVPISRIVAFNIGVNILYRTLFELEMEDSGDDGYYSYSYSDKLSIHEFALSLPLTFQVAPIRKVPIFFEAGFQIDLPFNTKVEYEYKYKECDYYYGDCYSDGDSGTEDFDDRSKVDIGFVWGCGYRLKMVAFDLRLVAGITPITSKREDKSSFDQFVLFGVSYFF